MRIKEFHITRYGPLKYRESVMPGDFTLFYGNNEDGKTLTIDALVKFLLGRNVKVFNQIDRVGENPEGFLIIEDNDGREIKFPESGNILSAAGLTQSEYRNIFIIRNSDLSIDREGDFYTNITDRLTGLRMEEIHCIMEGLIEIAKITPRGAFRDVSGEKLKTRIESAAGLGKKIDSLNEKLISEEYDGLVEKLVLQAESLERFEQQILSFENARMREAYERGKASLVSLKDSIARLEGLKLYDETDETLWRDRERDINKYNEEIEQLKDELKDKESGLKAAQGQLNNEEGNFELLKEKKKQIDEDIKPQLKKYNERRLEEAGQREKNKFLTPIWIFFLILTGLSLLSRLINPSILFTALMFFFLAAAAVTSFFKFRRIKRKAWLAKEFEKINSSLAKFGLNGRDIDDILLNLQKFADDFSQKSAELEKTRTEKSVFENNINSIRSVRIPGLVKKIDDAKNDIAQIENKSGEHTLQMYSEKVTMKGECGSNIKQQENILKNLFKEREGFSMKDNMSRWEDEIKGLEGYKDKAKGLSHNENDLSKLKGERDSTRIKLDELEEQIKGFQAALVEIEREANAIFKSGVDYLHCKTSLDLKVIKDRLKSFENENEQVKNDAMDAMKIFSDIESEEKEKISALFGKESPVSGYFTEITEGRYKEVIFDQEGMRIDVIRKDGSLLKADKLSSGAYDQLYLSIRLALGDSLLKEKKGFFIMDDPFIKADTERLKRQLETLRRISGWGWQVLYFSAKGEIKELLKAGIAAEEIDYVELPGTV